MAYSFELSQYIENILMFLIAFVIRIAYNKGCICSYGKNGWIIL